MRALVILVISIVGGRAWGEDRVRAEELYRVGQSAFEVGHFAEAARAFEAAYAAMPRPRLLWNAAQAHRRQFAQDGDPANLRRALALYEHYGELATNDHERADGRAMEDAVREELARAETERPPPSTPSRPLRKIGYTLLGVGGGLALVGAGFGIGAWSEGETVSATGSPSSPVPAARVAQNESLGQALSLTSYVFYGIAAGAAAAGLVLVLLPQRSAVRAWVAPAPGGLVVGGGW